VVHLDSMFSGQNHRSKFNESRCSHDEECSVQLKVKVKFGKSVPTVSKKRRPELETEN